MATIKSDLAITSFSGGTLTAATQGGAFTKGSTSGFKGKKNLGNLIFNGPFVKDNDWIIDSQYTLFSFPLSREWVEFGSFSNPKITLVIQGQLYNGNNDIQVIYNKKETGSSLICEWERYFGIIRAAVHFSNLIKFRTITAVGIVMTTNDNKKATGRIYTINNSEVKVLAIYSKLEAIIGSSYAIENITDVINITEFKKLSGATEHPVVESERTPIKGSLMVSPINMEINNTLYNLYGAYMSNEGNLSQNHLNMRYFNNAFRLDFKRIFWLGGSYYPSAYGIQKQGQEAIQWTSCKSTIIESIEDINADYTPNFQYLVYGGYEYKINDDDDDDGYKHQTLSPQSTWAQNTNYFFDYFTFTGERYRTKFIKYNGHNEVEVYTHYVHGKIEQKNNLYSPYKMVNSSGEQIFNNNYSTKKFSYNKSNTFEEINDYFITSSIEMINLFTLESTEVEIKIPLEDEYQYYLFGDIIGLQAPGDSFIDYSDQKEIVKYSDINIINGFEIENNVKLFKISKSKNEEASYSFFDIYYNSVNENRWSSEASIEWLEKQSYIPLTPSLSDFPGTSIEEPKGSYFRYLLPQIYMDGKYITDQIKFYWDFDYYTVLNCRAFPKDDNDVDGNSIITNLKIQDKKLYYTINKNGIGDYNDYFSINQFINYAIDGKHPIGLSFFDKQKWLDFYIHDGNDWIWVNSLGTNENDENLNDSGKTLKMFYTDMQHVIDLSHLDKLPNSGEIQLKIRYYNNTTKSDPGIPEKWDEGEYVIFEIVLGVIPIIAGSRPLGLRKNGIIINPITPNEELDNSAERINFKTSLDGQNKLFGSAIQLIAYDANGSKLKDSEGNYITCEIEYKGTKAQNWSEADPRYDGSFYFDGISLQELSGKVEKMIKALSDSSIIQI